jgi:hypothetical protein
MDEQYSYDVLYIPITSFYTFNGKTFDLHSVQVSLPDVPTEPEDVLDQYIKLSLLDVTDPEAQRSITKRIEQLSSISPLKLSEVEKDALNIISYSSSTKTKVSIEFSLSLVDGRWRITSAHKIN